MSDNNCTCKLNIYTQSGCITYKVIATQDNFSERLAEALEQGTALLDTDDGNKLLISAINVVAIEICEPEEKSGNTPPVLNLGAAKI